ncbi:ABC transporter ATP-binding protein [Massilibacteroides sp.]|uniref:ABC transporter ATP-binding protein n=1 Tax=Massilibacteroides sp. TaxID=2034766 RepID=UPI00261528F7|nr:ABC transporter ATP-binding protein [Massilibacteroides sp.]MDD4514196.1 ABC transporter ATP-binding protein [Massilibacteroides sp.]
MNKERQTVIKTEELSIGYSLKGGRQKVIHKGLNLSLYAGEVTCLLGLNGAGKSTLLRTLCGFQKSLSGAVFLQGKPLKEFSQSDFALAVGVVLTEKTNAGGITAYELVSLGRHPYTGFFGKLKEEDHRVIKESLEAVGVAHKAHQRIAELSDGEKQKVMIAKTLAQQCPIILLDEPTAFLDVTSRIETMVLLRKLAVEQNKAILLSTHDMDMAIQMGDCFWLLDKNRPIACGIPEDLILEGTFGSFFEKEGILFDVTTGKLNTEIPQKQIGVEGDFTTSYWVGNALVRNGFRPSEVSPEHINVICHSPTELSIQHPNGNKQLVNCVFEVIRNIKTKMKNE